MLMELAYRFAVEDTPFIQKIRRDAIVLITPIVETDGHDRMVDIYMQHKKHPDQPPYPLICGDTTYRMTTTGQSGRQPRTLPQHA